MYKLYHNRGNLAKYKIMYTHLISMPDSLVLNVGFILKIVNWYFEEYISVSFKF